MPRDNLLVIGSHVIEAPMVWKSRRRESVAYEQLFTEWVSAGAQLVRRPSAAIRAEQYKRTEGATKKYFESIITEAMPAFDAADFMRFGRDIVGQLSHVTNRSGVEWLRSVLGSEHTIHLMPVNDPQAMHIDATIMPLRAGLLLINPERVNARELEKGLFNDWQVVAAPPPTLVAGPHLPLSSPWLSMNLLPLDGERVLVEQCETELAQLLKRLGLEPIPVPFRNVYQLGGGLHCATLDIRRRGALRTHIFPTGAIGNP